jgi:PKD repeat protein
MTWDRTVRLVAGACFMLMLILLPAAVAGVDCDKVDGSPVVDFDYGVVPAESAPIMVNFYSTSRIVKANRSGNPDDIESYHWNFGDTSVSEETNPLHTYATSSARYQAEHQPYKVTLTVRTECGRSNTTTKNVSVYCLDQKAGFTIVQPVGDGPYTAPVAVYLKDTSLHVDDAVTTYHYTLWDSGMTRLFKESIEKDPVFIIPDRGSFVIRQEVFKGCNNAPALNTEMKKNIEVTGSGTSATSMEPIHTITPAVPETPATVATTVTASPSTVPALLPVVAPPGTGTLSVVTDPAGAQVFVNDVLLGSSPATITGLTNGSYHLRIEKSGYGRKTVLVQIGNGTITEYAATLEPESGGMGFLPIIAGVLVIAAGAGAVYWYRKKKPPATPDWNMPFD